MFSGPLILALSLLPCWIPTTTAFGIAPIRHQQVTTAYPTFLSRMSNNEDDNNISSDNEVSPATKRKRRRKIEATSSPSTPPPPAPQPLIELQPRDDTPVQMEIMDIRQIVGGKAPSEDSSRFSLPFFNSQSTSTATTTTSTPSQVSSSSLSSPFTSSSSSSIDDSLQQLLEDAKRMQEQDGAKNKEEASVKTTIRNALSTLVTADFFVVCGFLLWFLVGIFCSSVLKDDTIQIAFNSNFQAFVQPALGILMIASVAGNFFQEDEDGQGI